MFCCWLLTWSNHNGNRGWSPHLVKSRLYSEFKAEAVLWFFYVHQCAACSWEQYMNLERLRLNVHVLMQQIFKSFSTWFYLTLICYKHRTPGMFNQSHSSTLISVISLCDRKCYRLCFRHECAVVALKTKTKSLTAIQLVFSCSVSQMTRLTSFTSQIIHRFFGSLQIFTWQHLCKRGVTWEVKCPFKLLRCYQLCPFHVNSQVKPWVNSARW